MSNTVIILVSESSLPMAQALQKELSSRNRMGEDSVIICAKDEKPGCKAIGPYSAYLREHWGELDEVIFIGALGICVRSISPALKNKYRDPAVVCIDSTGRFVIPVVSGHIGGANDLARRISGIVGGEAVVTTQSDNEGLWALDTLAQRFGWRTDATPQQMQKAVFAFVGKHPTALLLEVRDKGTAELERTLPPHVKCFTRAEDIDPKAFELLLAVTPFIHTDLAGALPSLFFRPAVLHVGIGCRRDCDAEGIPEYIDSYLRSQFLDPLSVASVGTVELKKGEPLMKAMLEKWPQASFPSIPPPNSMRWKSPILPTKPSRRRVPTE